jgi:hypothetical protein
MLRRLKDAVKATPLAIPFIWTKGLIRQPATQNDEADLISALVARPGVAKRFVEFGFGGWEFNTAELAREWEGLLLDGDRYNVVIANVILPKRVTARQLWITRETLSAVRDCVAGRDLGILSIDVDGNDYWFLQDLIDLRPAIIISEYNSVLGLRSITVPYDDGFDRRKFGDGWYFGASLPALTGLARSKGYSLVAQASGINAFFVRDDLLLPGERVLDPAEAYQARHADKWSEIEHLPFVTV